MEVIEFITKDNVLRSKKVFFRDKKIIELLDQKLSRNNEMWTHNGIQLSSNDLKDRILKNCASGYLSDEYLNLDMMQSCLRSAYQKVYSEVNYK